jgi:hypothetical protein
MEMAAFPVRAGYSFLQRLHVPVGNSIQRQNQPPGKRDGTGQRERSDNQHEKNNTAARASAQAVEAGTDAHQPNYKSSGQRCQ